MKVSDFRIASSSSTTWTMRLSLIAFSHVGSRQREMESGSPAVALLRPDAATMRLDDRPADREAEAHAVVFGGLEGMEQPTGDLRGKSRPVVRHDDANMAAVAARGDVDEPSTPRGECLHRIAYQIDQHLLDLHPVDQHG